MGIYERKSAEKRESGLSEIQKKEANAVLASLEMAAEFIASGRKITEETLERNWPVWEKPVAEAAKMFSGDAKKLNFSYDPKVISFVTENAEPLPREIFKKFRGVITERDERKARLVMEVEEQIKKETGN